MSRIKNFFSLLETVFNSKRLRTILGALIFFVGLFGYLFYISEPNINSFGDGIWLALVTITTVGYGDIYPKSSGGRVIGVFVAFLGVCLFALPAGVLGSGLQ